MITEVLPKQDELDQAISNLQNNLAIKEARRKAWNETTKNLIIESLERIKTRYPLEWHVQRLEERTNMQTINISFFRQHTGITEQTFNDNGSPKSMKAYRREGGYLAYCQNPNGVVDVVIGFPTIEGITTQRPAEIIDRLEPIDITEDHVSLHVANFLNQITDWEMMKS